MFVEGEKTNRKSAPHSYLLLLLLPFWNFVWKSRNSNCWHLNKFWVCMIFNSFIQFLLLVQIHHWCVKKLVEIRKSNTHFEWQSIFFRYFCLFFMCASIHWFWSSQFHLKMLNLNTKYTAKRKSFYWMKTTFFDGIPKFLSASLFFHEKFKPNASIPPFRKGNGGFKYSYMNTWISCTMHVFTAKINFHIYSMPLIKF